MTSRLAAHASAALLGLLAARLDAQTYRISERTVHHRVAMDAEAFAEVSSPVHNPLRWPQVRYVVPDGAWAEAGNLIAAFDETEPSNELQRAYRTRTTAEAELARDMADIDNSDLSLRDRHAEILDRIAVLEARRERLLAVPDTNEVAIAESRLRVAGLAWEAASNEFAKAVARFDDKLISLQEREEREAERDSAAADRQHAEAMLAIARRPTPPHELRTLELELDTARLERDKVARELADNATLVAIRKRGAGVRLEQINRQVAEREEDVQATRVLAPLTGHVMYMTDFRRNVLDGGDRMWKNNIFLRIPDPGTLAFRGVIPEASRRFVDVGDPATIRIVGFGDTTITGSVASIGATARDTADREKKGWGESKEYGVKVYDVVVKPLLIEPWMRVGAHAEVAITASRPTTAPAVPLPFVRMVDARPHLAVDGRLVQVAGTVAGDVLLLEDRALLGREVALRADAGEGAAPVAPTNRVEGALFTTAGELVPAASTPVVVRRIHRWQKITWLIPEDSVVTQGMAVAKIDDKETLDDIAEWESRLTSHVTERETQEQNNAILNREQTYQLAVASNNVEAARVAYEAAREFHDDKAVEDARLALTKARVRARTAHRNLDRLARLPAERVAAVERTAATRDAERADLQVEAGELQFASARAGTAALDLERLRLAFEEARLDLDAKTSAAGTERIGAEAELLKARRREAHTRRNLAERRDMLANLTLTAPCDGTVRYNRVWNNDSFSRVQTGFLVGSRFVPLQIVDTSRMEVRAEVPERHFGDVRVGQTVEVRVPSALEAPLAGTIREIEYLFEQRRPKDAERGLYSSHEALGETVFFIRVEIVAPASVDLKPGAVATLAVRTRQEGTR